MNCPGCNTINNFAKENNSLYCRSCLRHLSAAEQKQYYAEHPEKKYNRNWHRRRNYYKQKPELSSAILLRDLAIVAHLSYDTIIKNRHNFDILPNTRPMRAKWNDKLLNWLDARLCVIPKESSTEESQT